ncbi:MAG: bifunctional phosphoribosylaminoimidazolecarboxamide formyltransferase/IMP cyclohydrolase [Bacteriovoracia bacterium]
MNALAIRRVLMSVSDKSCLEDLGKVFRDFGVEILATGGTAKALEKSQIPYRTVESFAGNPEAFDGRMKTLSFALESAILFDRNDPKHVREAKELNIEPIDCVVCNFYPFEKAAAENRTAIELVHEVDIGGPTMVRAAAKNHHSVLVLVDPSDYEKVIQEMKANGGCISFATRQEMMRKAFARVAEYDLAIADAFSKRDLRYGENPAQKAYFTNDLLNESPIEWQSPTGIELSYNNILDAHAAYGVVCEVKNLVEQQGSPKGVVAIVKHNNPCGVATGESIEEAFLKAWQGDPVSSFGGVVCLSAPLTQECARLFDEKFVEIILAPDFEKAAVEDLTRKKKKLRLLKVKRFVSAVEVTKSSRTSVFGGVLVQENDRFAVKEEFKTVTETRFPEAHKQLGMFGVVCVKWLKSNAVCIVRQHEGGGFQMIGTGCGQTNRIDCIKRLAVPKAKEIVGDLRNSVLVSDAFFPFKDAIEEINASDIKYVVQPGGSIRDSEVVETCNRFGVAMAFTGSRHFRH